MEYHPTPTTTPSLSSILATLSSYAPPPRREYVLPEPTPKLTSQPSASTIVTWPPALRHMLALAQNQDVIHRIRHLIQEQHSHERQWWRGREELVRKQQGREEARGKLDGVLKGLGGHVTASNHISDAEADARELNRYDRKVHIACGEMIAATEKELKCLGVPFFSLKEDLIRRSGDRPRQEGGGDDADVDGKIEQEALIELKGKMVGLLEDLCKE